MQPISTRTVTSNLITTAGGTTTITEVPAMHERLSCSPPNPGNKVDPTDFFFRLTRQYGNSYSDNTYGVGYDGKNYLASVTASFRIWQATSLGESDPLGTDWARTDDRCMEKIYDQLRGNSNAAVDFLEGGSTLRMIANVRKVRREFIRSVIGATKSKKYRGLTNGQQRLDYVTSKWLEYRYGWMPLIYSTYDALDTLGRRITGGLFPVTGRSGVKTVEVFKSGSSDSFSDPATTVTRTFSFRTEICAQFRLPEGNQLYDWTSLNPVGIAWELMPLSFVADWFVNVGDTLTMWENYFLFANKFVRGYRTRSYKESVVTSSHATYRRPYVYAPNGDIYPGVYGQTMSRGDRVERRYLQRVVLDSLPLPAQGIRVKPDLNAKRLLDAVSLFHVFTKKKVREISGRN